MRAIIVDDEVWMLRRFERMTADIEDFELVGSFEDAEEALAFAKTNAIDAAFLDVEMGDMDGIELAERLRELRKDLIVVFVTAHESYIAESNRIGADYYLVKPYTEEIIAATMEKLRLLADRQAKSVYIRTFGRFLVTKDGVPVRLTGKAKEILALIVTRRGREVSNEELYRTIWEGRPCDNVSMNVYYNALRRLRTALAAAGLGGLLVSTARGQTVDTRLFDCDFYDWKDGVEDAGNPYEGEFLSEYSWSEYLMSELTR